MKEPGLDDRHRDHRGPKGGEIQQKRSDALNGNLPRPIAGFRADASVARMRQVTGMIGINAIRQAARDR